MSDEEWIVERFDRKHHDRSQFDCGVEELNTWLRERAGQYEKRDLARTYVLVQAKLTQVRGYYALANHMVQYESLPDDLSKGLPRIDVPVALIGRLAIDKDIHGRRLGEFLLLDALRRVQQLADKIGIRAVEVDAKDDSAGRFYERYGFVPLIDDPRHLFLPMSVIRKLNIP